jgi:hypothetical protein
MKIEVPFNHVPAAQIDCHIVGWAINESGAHPVFRIIDLRAV